MNINTLRYWHKLEHFYPYILEEQRDENITTYYIKDASDYPDYKNQDIPPKKEIRYYEVYLGIFKVDSALKVLAEKMNAQKEFRDESDETSCFCKIRVESDGTFDKENFRISSFPWAVQRVNNNEIYLEHWDEEFQLFQREFFFRFFNCHMILTYEIFEDILKEIKKLIGWNIDFESCWMRVDRVIGEQYGNDSATVTSYPEECVLEKKSENDIQLENKRVDELIKANDLLNSFYVRDLERIIEQVNENNYGVALDRFVEHKNETPIDIEKDKDMLFAVFNPQNYPLGKWPSGFALRAMQQVSVNLALSKELNTEKIFSVNGPPGTGKTTLLRDIIAAYEVERAIQLLDLDMPNNAFLSPIGEVNDNGFKIKIMPLISELSGYGILVASNNNAAVKNISEELPLKSSIDKKYQGQCQYFSEVSDRLLGGETWGIFAAALGNYQNKSRFMESFWPVFPKEKDKDKFDFYRYLKSIHTGADKRSGQEYRRNWEEAKNKFKNVYLQIQELYKEMQNCYVHLIQEKKYAEIIKDLSYQRTDMQKQLEVCEKQCQTERQKIDEIEKLLSRKIQLKGDIKKNTTFFWLKYFIGNSLKEYKDLEKEVQNLIMQKGCLFEDLDEIQAQRTLLEREIGQISQRIDYNIEQQKECKKFIEDWSKLHETIVPNGKYISDLLKEDGDERVFAQNTSPWNGKEIIQLRERLFLEAVNLHRTFIENSSYLYWQLEGFYKLIKGKFSKEEAIEYATPLFQSFQLVLPVISSTFASVGTFLKYAGRDTFGLLLIDEAGQALPQSAVGAIWRAEKSIIVGDPLQIEPVVTIHDKTIQLLKQYFQQSDFIASKDTSVQSLADSCNRFGGWREYTNGKKWIGSPLLVHGRCQRSIFDIANIIAYNKKMIYGTKDVESAECVWKHVTGSATNKHFVPEQANAILGQVIKAFNDAWAVGQEIPSLFIITPFRSVKAGLIHYFNSNDFLVKQICKATDLEKKNSVRNWIFKNIGTIHTFQGKEADKVIICLGVDSGDKGYGAIQWASQKPNILNVAATRAKKQLYIVGDKNKWATQPYFNVANEICEKHNSVK